MSLITILFCLLVLAFFISRRYQRPKSNPKGLPLPPGPKGLPFIGLSNIPKDYSWLTFAKWAEEYGDIMHVKVLGADMIYLTSAKVANELFDRRAFSDRPRMVMVNEIMGWDFNFSFLPYGSRWRRYRRAFHQFFHSGIVHRYQPSQTLEARKILLRLIDSPDDLFHHVRHLAAASILRVAYGIEVSDTNDKYISVSEEALGNLSDACNPGSFLVDLIPILKYIPEWVPGARFQKIGKAWYDQLQYFKNLPFDSSKPDIELGKAPDSTLALMLEHIKNSPNFEEDEELARATAATSYAGGSDTTVSTIQSFFLAMVMYPEVQKKAQAELDMMIGKNRLPTFEDRPFLPYVDALVKESFRWHTVLPLGVVHRVDEDDEYNGYFIPKGTLVTGNIWAMMHDKNIYADPFNFKPERFLDEDGRPNMSVPQPDTAFFGFGRRICPGRHMASNLAFITIASALATLDISHATDETGNPIPVGHDVTSGFFSYPAPFKCAIRPRNSDVLDLINHSLVTVG